MDSFCDKYTVKGIFAETKFKYIDISDWDVSNVTDMRYMFCGCKELKSVGDLSNWDVSNVTNMSHMFVFCKKFNQDLSSWDVSNVTNMQFMFYGCISFNQDISRWDVSKEMYKMCAFDKCPIKKEYKPKFK